MKKKNLTRLMSGILSAVMVITQVPISGEVMAKESGITAIGKQTNLVADRYTSSGVESKIYAKDGDGVQSLADTAVAESMSLTGKGTASIDSSKIAPGSAYSVATAFDPDGDGVADWMARLSLADEERGGKILLSVSMAAAGDGSGKPYVAFLNQDTGGYIATTDDISPRGVEGLINIAAGDFDGDGMEELAVYAPNNSDEVETQVADAEGNYPKNQLSLKIYDMDFNLDTSNIFNFHIKESLPEPTKVIEAGDGMTEWNYSVASYKRDADKQYHCIPYLSMMTEDVDGDGIGDLTTVANFSPYIGGYHAAGNILYLDEPLLFSPDFCLASVLDIYTGSKSSTEYMTQTVKKKVLMGYDGSANKGAGTMFAVRNATVALGSVTDSNSRELIIAGNCTNAYQYNPANSSSMFAMNAGSAHFLTYTNAKIAGMNLWKGCPAVVLGCFAYEDLTDEEEMTLETVSKWDWTYTDSGYSKVTYYSDRSSLELEPVAMVPFAAHGTEDVDSIFLEGQVYQYNTETKEFEDTGYTPAFTENQSDSKDVWLGSAVAGNVTVSEDGAETVYYTYYEKNTAGTAYYGSIVGLWGEEADGAKTYNSVAKSNTTAAFPVHTTLALAEKKATADGAFAEITFAEGEFEEDGTITLVEGGCTPKVLVTYNGKQLRLGKDYYVTYADNTEAGTATATITGIGDYTGTGTLSFEIKSPEGEGDEGEVTYEVETIAPITAGNRTWDSYKSYYYYNLLNEAGKAFWNELDAVCKELLTTTKNASALLVASGNPVSYTTGSAKTTQLTRTEVREIASQFLYSNPQYYFLTNMASLTPSGDTIYYSFEVNPEFAKGDARQEANTLIEQKLAEYYEEIDACGSDEEKVRKIHDLMLKNLEPTSGTTIYDALVIGESQCEGYAELFQMLANGAGINSVVICDIDEYCHAWNMVNLNGSWYVVDVMWDDPVDGDGSLYYLFYLVSDVEHEGLNQYADSWCQPIPESILSSGSTQNTAGTIQAAKGYTFAPKIVVDATSGSTVVTITAKSTETIYYSLDGSTPGLSRGASAIYTEPITIENPCVIKAVAVRDGYIDNKMSVQTIRGIQFDGNGCDEGTVSNILFGLDTQVTIPENSYVKEGYRFNGWNTAADGTGIAYEAGENLEVASVEGSLVLYAQWELEEYAITYELAGGTNNTGNPDSYTMSDETITLADAEKTGYYFEGWYTDTSYSNESKVTTIPSGSTGDITLYAKWKPYIYHVSFKPNGGEGTMDKVSNCEFGTIYTFPANQFTREGYTFVGWCDRSDGSTTIYKDQGEFSDLYVHDNITVVMFAIWEKEGASDNPAKEETGITVVPNVSKVYTVGDTFVPDFELYLTMSDGASVKVEDASAAVCSGYDMSKAGKQTVTVSYKGFETTYEITVKEKGSSSENPTITGIKVIPKVTAYKVGDTFSTRGDKLYYVLSDGTETVIMYQQGSYSGYDMSKAGKQTVTVTFEEFTTTFEITVEDSGSDVTPTEKKIESVTLSQTTYTYTGKALKPSVTVKDTDGKVVGGECYSVVYFNNTNVGTAKVKVLFSGDYAGNEAIEKTFIINPKGTKISKLKPGKKKLTVKVKAQKKQISGYQIRYSLKKNMSKAKLVKLGKKTSKTISKLKGKKTYYVQVRTYTTVSGKTYYSEWSKAVSKKVKK